MKFLTEFDKILPFVIGLFSKEELEVFADSLTGDFEFISIRGI